MTTSSSTQEEHESAVDVLEPTAQNSFSSPIIDDPHRNSISRPTNYNNNNNNVIAPRNVQIIIDESWLEGMNDAWGGIAEIIRDVVDAFLHPFTMDATTLTSFSVALLLVDLLINCIGGMVDEILLVQQTSIGSISSTSSLTKALKRNIVEDLSMRSALAIFMDGPTKLKHFLSAASADKLPVDDLEVCQDGTHTSFGRFGRTSTLAQVVAVAIVLGVLVNTSYFSMLVTPLYSRIMARDGLSTEALLGLLLLLFGLETVTVFSFFLLGYKLLSIPLDATLDTVTVQNNDAINHASIVQQDGMEANLLLILSTVLWLFCVVTSNIVRVALYHSIGD